jgi:hypothetical protein
MKDYVVLRKNKEGDTVLVLPYRVGEDKLSVLCFYKGNLINLNYFDIFAETKESEIIDCVEDLAELGGFGFDLKVIEEFEINFNKVLEEQEKMQKVVKALRGLGK